MINLPKEAKERMRTLDRKIRALIRKELAKDQPPETVKILKDMEALIDEAEATSPYYK